MLLIGKPSISIRAMAFSMASPVNVITRLGSFGNPLGDEFGNFGKILIQWTAVE